MTRARRRQEVGGGGSLVAVARGRADATHMTGDPALAPLRASPRFKALVTKRGAARKKP